MAKLLITTFQQDSLTGVPDSRALSSHERVILRLHPENPEPRTEVEGPLVLVSLGAVSDSDDWKAAGSLRSEIT
jgi:hypothetical protein